MKVDIVDLNGADAQRLVTESLIKSGFAIVKNHKISTLELNALYEDWDNFFSKGNPGQYVTLFHLCRGTLFMGFRRLAPRSGKILRPHQGKFDDFEVPQGNILT